MKIVLATHNKDKCLEMMDVLSNFNIELLTLHEFPEIGEIIEDGATLEDNALIKARFVQKLTKLPALADDTGLEVDALGGAPGVFSARYAGQNCSYSDNVNKLLEDMKTVPNDKRMAKFRTVMAFVDDKMELIAEDFVEGIITDVTKGIDGFGYDPVFYVLEMNKTYAEMSMKEKNQISHRGKALMKMQKLLQGRLPKIFHQMEDLA
jgi:XTP/dITP diphosphohydrolase